MTSTTDTDAHPEVAEISALSEGILPPARTADVRAHIAACELCEDVRTSLDEIRGLLGTLPGPVRMPTDVAGRIDAALAAEALLNATAPDGPDVVSRETTSAAVPRETAAERRPVRSRPAGRARAATGPGRPASGSGGRIRARRWPKILLGTACAAAVLTLGGLILPSGSAHDPGSPHGDKSGSTDASALAADNLRTHVQELLATTPKPSTTRKMSAQNSPETLRDDGTTAPACVREGLNRSEPPLASHQETYQGADAYLIVLPHAGDSRQVDAYVVSAACANGSPASSAKVLLSRTYPRD